MWHEVKTKNPSNEGKTNTKEVDCLGCEGGYGSSWCLVGLTNRIGVGGVGIRRAKCHFQVAKVRKDIMVDVFRRHSFGTFVQFSSLISC